MALDYDTDVLICGAGAAGLTLAIDLARRGVSFLLIEKADTPFHGSRGKGIQPRSLEIFEDLGVLDRLMATGRPYPLVRTHRPDGSVADAAMMEVRDATPAEPYPIPLMLPQFLTEAILRERLAELGHRPRFGHRLERSEQDAAAVTAQIVTEAGAQTIRARYLIGADGGRSFVRETLGIAFPGKALDTRAIVADLVLRGLDRDAWHRFEPAGGGVVLICPLAGTDLFQLQSTIALEGDVDLSREGIENFIRTRTGRKDIQVDAVRWASAYSMSARLADGYRIGRVFLAGDAAHVHPPTGAQGLNTSVQDAYNLGWKLAAVLGGAPETLLESYEAERRPVAAAMLGLSSRLLGDAKEGPMRRGRETQQLGVGYADSPITVMGSRTSDGLRAGDRAPDAPIGRASGQQARLFDLFRGTHWTLLGHETDPSIIEPRKALHIHIIGRDIVDDCGAVAEAYSLAAGDWVLVRPDGYIAGIGANAQAGAIDRFLNGMN